MYKILSYLMEDGKKDFFIKGTMYDSKKKTVGKIFDQGIKLNPTEINSPFTIIVDEKLSSVKNKKTKDKVSVSVNNAGSLFLGSNKVEDLFTSLKIDNVQFFDVRIKSSIGEVTNYKIFNITDKFDCVDFSKSELTLFDSGNIERIKKLVLDPNKIPFPRKIFLLGRKTSQIIIIHDDLRQAIEEEGLTGFVFIDLQNAGKIY